MSRPQTAIVNAYPFGAPVDAGAVLVFRVNRGGKVQLTFVADDTDIAVTVQVSADGSTWANTAAGTNLTAIVAKALVARANYTAEVLLRQGVDKYMRVTASGGGRGELQIRALNASDLDIVAI